VSVLAGPDALDMGRASTAVVEADSPVAASDISAVDERAGRAAERLGIASADVERLPFDLSALDADGAFLNVDVQNFGLLDRRLDWQSLGITLPRGADLAFRPPRCGVVPDRYRLPLVRPAAQAHVALHRFSYHFRLVETVFESAAYRWVPWRAWPAFEEAFERARANLRAALQAYDDDFPSIQQRVQDTYRLLAADSARRLAATGRPVPADFEDAVVRGVLTTLPTPSDLRARLRLRYRVGVFHLGSEMVAEQRRTAQERQRLAVVEAELAMQNSRRLAERRLMQQEIWADQERRQLQLRAEQEDARREAAVKERLRQLKLEAARERLQEALSPIEEGARQLHAAVFEAATAIRASLLKNDALRGSSARKARELSRWFRLMAWQGDEDLEVLLRELERLASAPAGRKGKRDPGPLNQVLGDIIERCYADARELAEPSRMSALEL